ncbi:hypothetical protein ACFFV7_38825 [Nonomuraea spiralis]|uniref:Uncharacterized protein n=1 Tax=Nonomuraea spiralis TaxID=46182 RepID=A0ABV5IRN3_9ACTN|nr:hypothetical protein [Nonomuraea spiralis]
MIGALGFVATLQVTGAATAGPAPVTCEMGGTGQLTLESPPMIPAGAVSAQPFQARLDISNVAAAPQKFPGGDIQGLPAQISGRVTFSLEPGKQDEDSDHRTAEMLIHLSGTAVGGRAVLTGFGTLGDGTWKAVPGTHRLHATNLALTIPGAGPCHVSDIEPVGEFFVQPPATGEDEGPTSAHLVATIRRIMIALVVGAVGVFLYANRPKRFRRARKPRPAAPRAPRPEQAAHAPRPEQVTRDPRPEQAARAPRKVPELAGFESRPHLRLFRTFASIAGGCLLTLGLVVSCAIDRRTTLDDLPGLPVRPSPPVPDRAWPTAVPSHAGARREPPGSPFSGTRPTFTPARPSTPVQPGR